MKHNQAEMLKLSHRLESHGFHITEVYSAWGFRVLVNGEELSLWQMAYLARNPHGRV